MNPKHIDYFIHEKDIITPEGKVISIFKLNINDDEIVLNSWAKHLREHYCVDSEIDILRKGYNLSRSDYLSQIKFPDGRIKPGPSVRSGDFTEILVADYIQYVLEYCVPRTRYDRKSNRNSSTMGSDLIGYKCEEKVKKTDELIIFEVKATASEVVPDDKPRLQDAVNDSNKDILRLAESLNAIVQRLIDRDNYEEAQKVQRFQNSTDTPYITVYAAAAVHSNKSYSENTLQTIMTLNHIDPKLKLIVIHCDKLMAFIHDMYRRACEC